MIYDSPYCQKFIEFVNEKFNWEEHVFIIVKSAECFSYVNEKEKNILLVQTEQDVGTMIRHITNSEKVFIHFLFDWICEFWVKNNLLKTPTYWMPWGGDFYPYIDHPLYGPETKKLLQNHNIKTENFNNSVYRREFLKCIEGVLTPFPKDYALIQQYYSLKAKRYPFCYPLDTRNKEENLLDQVSMPQDVFLLGNSASPTNNHLDLFAEIKRNEGVQQSKYIVPLSYGRNEWYCDAVKKFGRDLFGERIFFLEKFIKEDEYLKMIQNLKGGCFFHLRQQAVGTMHMLIENEKIVFAYENPVTQWLEEENVKIFSLKQFSERESLNFNRKDNAEITKGIFSMSACFENMQKIFSA